MDWAILSDAIKFYEQRGYQYCDVPWIVEDSIARLTYDGEGLICQKGTLVGSAEQGFLALDLRDDAKYVSCSPCFRNEPVIDHLHRTWFMKVELYMNGSHLEEVVEDAMEFFGQYLKCAMFATHEGWDICAVDGWVELGSYGVRLTDGRHWTYGTGVAVPRLTDLITPAG